MCSHYRQTRFLIVFCSVSVFCIVTVGTYPHNLLSSNDYVLLDLLQSREYIGALENLAKVLLNLRKLEVSQIIPKTYTHLLITGLY